jgi:hypothetical protein
MHDTERAAFGRLFCIVHLLREKLAWPKSVWVFPAWGYRRPKEWKCKK